MLSSIIKLFSPWHRQLEISLAGLLVTTGLLTFVDKPVLSKESQVSSSSAVVLFVGAFGKETTTFPKGIPEVDGVYLYGQSPEPEQIGQEYMVFEVHQGKVIGAFYLPQSEFSCFSGTIKSGQLALKVANSPDSSPYPDSGNGQDSQQVATTSNSSYIDSNNSVTYPYSVALQNYHQLASVSANDQRILTSCKNND